MMAILMSNAKALDIETAKGDEFLTLSIDNSF
jgi:hypothetical protein